MKKWLVVLLVLLFGLIVGFGFWQNWLIKPLLIGEANNPSEGVSGVVGGDLAAKTAISAYLDLLASMENCKEGIIDVNGLISKGDFCFQEQTYLYFVKRYNLYPYAEEQELLSNWGDTETQRIIIKAMIEENPQLLRQHFYTSVVVRDLGLPELNEN